MPASPVVEQAVGGMTFGWGNRRTAFGSSLYKGQLGVGDLLDHPYPKALSFSYGFFPAKFVSSGLTSFLVARTTFTTGTIAGWIGSTENGESGTGSVSTSAFADAVFTNAAHLQTIRDISAGGIFDGGGGDVLIAHDNGSVTASGQNFSGQLGSGDTVQRSNPLTTWNPASRGGLGIIQVECGSNHSAMLDTNGEVWTAGANDHGQLGRGTIGVSDSSWGKVNGLSGKVVTQISCGHRTTLFVISDGTVWAVGNGADNRLGHSIAVLSGSHTATATQIPGVVDCVEARQVSMTSWFRSSTGRLFFNGTRSPSSAVLSTLGPTESDLGFSFPLEIVAPATGVTYAKLAYTSGYLGMTDNQGMMAIGSDSKLYVQGDGFFFGPGDNTQTNYVAFTNTTGMTNVQSATFGWALYWASANGQANRYHFPAAHDATDPTYQWKVTRLVGDNPTEPTGWPGVSFSDSSWTTPVVASTGVAGAPNFAGSTDVVQLEPVWPVVNEPATLARMLMRLHFTLPAEDPLTIGYLATGARNFTYGTTSDITGRPPRVTTPNQTGFGISGQESDLEWMNGHGSAAGIDHYKSVLAGSTNVFGIAWDCDVSASPDQTVWVAQDMIVAYITHLVTAGVTAVLTTAGRSSVQFVG